MKTCEKGNVLTRLTLYRLSFRNKMAQVEYMREKQQKIAFAELPQPGKISKVKVKTEKVQNNGKA